MKRFGVLFRIVVAVVLAQLAWTWLQRHDANLRIRRVLEGRSAPTKAVPPDNGAVKIVQFYARAADMIDGERNLICYGVRNARALRLDPPVESVAPALVRCFWVEPRQDTTYKLVAEGFDGKQDEVSFSVRVRPPPPVFRLMAVSDKAIPPGEVVTVCYGVEHATAVRLDPIGWKLPPVVKNCIRFYPKQTMDYTLVASGTAGLEEREKFRVAVK